MTRKQAKKKALHLKTLMPEMFHGTYQLSDGSWQDAVYFNDKKEGIEVLSFNDRHFFIL